MSALVRGVGVVAAVSLAMLPGHAVAEPYTCELAITATPPTLAPGVRSTQLRFPGTLAEGAQVRASAGTVAAPAPTLPGLLAAVLTAAPDSPPLVVVGGVSRSACGLAVLWVQSSAPVPPKWKATTLVMVEPASLRADREGEALVYVFAADDKGTPRQGPAPALKPSSGTITRMETLAPGAWRGRWRVPAGPAGSAQVEASFAGEASASATLTRAEGPVSAIELGTDPAGARGGGPALLARVRDSAGNPSGAAVELSSEAARFGPAERLERGLYRFPILATPGIRDGAILVTARAERHSVTVTVPIAGPAADIRVNPVGPVYAGSASRARLQVLEVTVVDALGQPVGDVPVGSASRGEFQPALSLGQGRWALPYRPPEIAEDTTQEVEISAGRVSTTLVLNLVARRLTLALGAQAGLALGLPEGTPGPAAGVELGLWTFLGKVQLGLQLDLGWWMLARTATVALPSGPADFTSTRTVLPATVSFSWRMTVAESWQLWASAGGGGQLLLHRADLTGQPALHETGLVPMVVGSVAGGRTLGPGALVLELRAAWTPDPRLATLAGPSYTFLSTLGYRFDVD